MTPLRRLPSRPLPRSILPIAATTSAFALMALIGAAFAVPPVFLINESPSLPRGVYLRTASTPDRGAVVALAQPSEARPYLASLGMPARTRLLKRVAASAGDPVCAVRREVRLRDRTLPVRVRDRRGVALPQWSGCRRLEADERFLVGDTVGSFDSRYFGPVRTVAIEGVYRRIWTW